MPDLTRLVNDVSRRVRKTKARATKKFVYPPEVVTAAMVQRYAKYGVEFSIPKDECKFLYRLHSQAEAGSGIYGSGLLLSERMAAKHIAADCAVSKHLASEHAEAQVWELSQEEREIVKALGRHDDKEEDKAKHQSDRTACGQHRGQSSRTSWQDAMRIA